MSDQAAGSKARASGRTNLKSSVRPPCIVPMPADSDEAAQAFRFDGTQVVELGWYVIRGIETFASVNLSARALNAFAGGCRDGTLYGRLYCDEAAITASILARVHSIIHRVQFLLSLTRDGNR